MEQRFKETNNPHTVRLCLASQTGSADRGELFAEFRNSATPSVIVGPYDIIGVSHNFQNARHVVIFDPPWTGDKVIQAQGRVHRVGQEEPSNSYKIVQLNSYYGSYGNIVRYSDEGEGTLFPPTADQTIFLRHTRIADMHRAAMELGDFDNLSEEEQAAMLQSMTEDFRALVGQAKADEIDKLPDTLRSFRKDKRRAEIPDAEMQDGNLAGLSDTEMQDGNPASLSGLGRLSLTREFGQGAGLDSRSDTFGTEATRSPASLERLRRREAEAAAARIRRRPLDVPGLAELGGARTSTEEDDHLQKAIRESLASFHAAKKRRVDDEMDGIDIDD